MITYQTQESDREQPIHRLDRDIQLKGPQNATAKSVKQKAHSAIEVPHFLKKEENKFSDQDIRFPEVRYKDMVDIPNIQTENQRVLRAYTLDSEFNPKTFL